MSFNRIMLNVAEVDEANKTHNNIELKSVDLNNCLVSQQDTQKSNQIKLNFIESKQVSSPVVI